MGSFAKELVDSCNGSASRKASDEMELEKIVDHSIFNTEGKGLIDMVLAYDPTKRSKENSRGAYREIFEEKLREAGLQIEKQDLDESLDGKTCFLKIHAPWDCLARTAEINRVRVPIRKAESHTVKRFHRGLWLEEVLTTLKDKGNPFTLEKKLRPPEPDVYFTTEFCQDKMDTYLYRDSKLFFNPIERIRLVADLLERTVIDYSEIDPDLRLPNHKEGEWVGLRYLLAQKVFTACYPLHDGDIKVDMTNPDKKPEGFFPVRPWLFETWARFGRLYKMQPIDQIRLYFGEKIAFYFAWLGFYTAMLVPLSIVGLICFVFGLVYTPFDTPMLEVCSKYKNLSHATVCRLCQTKICPYHLMNDYCIYAVVTVIFNNFSTIFFALVTSLWAVFFLELWKRKQARLACKWDMFDLHREYEPPRPEYQAAAKEKRRHPITNEWEPYISDRSRRQQIFKSISAVTFIMCVLLSIIAGIILYRVTMVVIYHNLNNKWIQKIGSSTFTTITASCINMACILILENIYYNVAWTLTEWEYPRTMSDFEKSYTYKMYIFQFINYYATLFYLAFIQGNVATTPDELTRFTDHCSPVGCTFSVTTQIAIILTVKQLWNNCVEIWYPAFKHCWRTRRVRKKEFYSRYEKDFDLPELPKLGLFQPYLEMVLQYGFVALFGAAFPLAPLLALCNNLFEIRIDALKFVRNTRRAMPEKACNIGDSWYGILVFITRLSILTNALLIAFTTDLIDRIVYMSMYSQDGSLKGFMNFTMSVFDTRDWPNSVLIDGGSKFGNVSSCRYRGYYNPAEDSDKYNISSAWWRVILVKIAFVLIFQNVIFWFQSLIEYVIPDTPKDVILHVQRNYYVSKSAAEKHEEDKLHTKGFHEVKKKLGELREEFFSKSAAPVLDMSAPVAKPRKSRRPLSDATFETHSRVPLLCAEEGFALETPRNT